MTRIEGWPGPDGFEVKNVVWFTPTRDIIEWLDATPGRRFRLELIDNVNYTSRAAASFASADDALLFSLTWNFYV